MNTDPQRIQDLLKSVEQHHEDYLRSLRTLYETSLPRATSATSVAAPPSITTRPAESRTTSIAEVPSPSLRAHTFASDVLAQHHSFSRSRRPTLEAPERPTFYPAPSPRPLIPVTPNPAAANGAGGEFEDISFIPLLDLRHEASHGSTGGGLAPAAGTAAPVKRAPSSVDTRTGKTLARMSFTDDVFLTYLRDTTFTEEMSAVLEEMLRHRHELDGTAGTPTTSLRDFAAFERESYVSSTFEAYEVGEDGVATKMSVDADMNEVVKYAGDTGTLELSDGVIDAPIVWDALKDVNASGDAVGRITIVQEPTPLMLAALQLTMSPYFDMSELTYHLLSDKPNRGQTHAFMQRAFERNLHEPAPAPAPPQPPLYMPVQTTAQLRQRSFYFVFKYYTSVGDGLEPAPWQRYEKRPSDKKLADHIDIAECSSVLALSLGGDPVRSIRMRPRRERAREGFLYDTLGPWHVLSMQSFPDDEHTVRGEEFVAQKTFGCGPHAFLDLLVTEYRDAGKRNLILHEKITKLITPPTEFMFDRRLRDKLLFEDKHFTYIRRYFWAYNTLAVINTGLAAMVAAYTNTFTPDFWSGDHPLLWPYPTCTSSAADAAAYRKTMASLRIELEKVVSDISAVMKRNERTRKEIENLRDQLFSGSSIKESRRAIDQGDNIQILTMISMIFLPLTFVTSVFGITEFTIAPSDWRFAVTMVLVCVPFMAIIVLLQTNGFTFMVRRGREGLVNLVARYRGGESPGSGSGGRVEVAGADGARVGEGVPTSSQARRRKRRLVAAASGRVVPAQWRWKRPWRRGRAMHDENLESGRMDNLYK